MPMQELIRFQPAMPVQAYQTFMWTRPLATHWKQARCEQAECRAYLNGWVTTLDESTELGQKQAYYIRHDKSRTHTEEHLESGLTEFRFPAGQNCFAGSHSIPAERPPVFTLRGGDWRGNPTGLRIVCKNGAEWADRFSEHQGKLADQIRKG